MKVPAELGEQKCKLSHRHSELGSVKGKKKKKECSGLPTVLFIFFVLRKRKDKNLFLLFLLTATERPRGKNLLRAN